MWKERVLCSSLQSSFLQTHPKMPVPIQYLATNLAETLTNKRKCTLNLSHFPSPNLFSHFLIVSRVSKLPFAFPQLPSHQQQWAAPPMQKPSWRSTQNPLQILIGNIIQNRMQNCLCVCPECVYERKSGCACKCEKCQPSIHLL